MELNSLLSRVRTLRLYQEQIKAVLQKMGTVVDELEARIQEKVEGKIRVKKSQNLKDILDLVQKKRPEIWVHGVWRSLQRLEVKTLEGIRGVSSGESIPKKMSPKIRKFCQKLLDIIEVEESS